MNIWTKIKQLFSNPKCITCGKPIDNLVEDGKEHVQCKIDRIALDCINENNRMYEDALKRLNETFDNK